MSALDSQEALYDAVESDLRAEMAVPHTEPLDPKRDYKICQCLRCKFERWEGTRRGEAIVAWLDQEFKKATDAAP